MRLQMQSNLKGQVSLDQMVTTALALTFVTVLFYLSLVFALDSVRSAQARDSVESIAKTADYVYSLGAGSKSSITINFPEGIKLLNISDRRVHMRVSLPSGESDIFANTRAALNGNIGTSGGIKNITLVSSADGSIVSING